MTARRIFFVLICTLVLFVFLTPDVLGQPGDPDPPDGVPITGIEYLLGGGILYGIRSLLKKARKE
jgi:hypothetical protein